MQIDLITFYVLSFNGCEEETFLFSTFFATSSKMAKQESFDSSMFFEMGLRLVSPEDSLWLGNGLISRKMTETSINRVYAYSLDESKKWRNGTDCWCLLIFLARARPSINVQYVHIWWAWQCSTNARSAYFAWLILFNIYTDFFILFSSSFAVCTPEKRQICNYAYLFCSVHLRTLNSRQTTNGGVRKHFGSHL